MYGTVKVFLGVGELIKRQGTSREYEGMRWEYWGNEVGVWVIGV
jgi:hypothetical protein